MEVLYQLSYPGGLAPAEPNSLSGDLKGSRRNTIDLKKLFNKAKKTVDDRGGVESLKADAQELKDIAGGKGSLTDKAKNAAAAIKEPGVPEKEER